MLEELDFQKEAANVEPFRVYIETNSETEIDLGSLASKLSSARKRKNPKRGEKSNQEQDLQMHSFVDEHLIVNNSDLNLGLNLNLRENGGNGKEWWKMQERANQVDSFEESGQVGPHPAQPVTARL